MADKIVSKSYTDEYGVGWDRIWGLTDDTALLMITEEIRKELDREIIKEIAANKIPRTPENEWLFKRLESYEARMKKEEADAGG